MNSLSWLIYLADVAGSVSGVLTISSIISALACVAAGITYLCCLDGPALYSWDDKQKKIAAHDQMLAFCKTLMTRAPFVFAACALAASIIPGKTTIYAIAASEMGEKVINSQTGDKAVKALNAWLDKQIADETKEAAK